MIASVSKRPRRGEATPPTFMERPCAGTGRAIRGRARRRAIDRARNPEGRGVPDVRGVVCLCRT